MNESTQEPNETGPAWEQDFHRWGRRPQPGVRPFFYARLQARLAQSAQPVTGLPWWLRQPAYGCAALALLVVLNVGAAWWVTYNRPVSDQVTTVPLADPLFGDYDIDPVILAYE